MTLKNPTGEKVYFNTVKKHGEIRYQIQAASGQTLKGRDGETLKSRTFTWLHQAEAFLKRNGYTVPG